MYKISGKLLRDYQKKILEPILSGKKKHLFLVMPRRSGKSALVYWLVNYLINKYWIETKKPCQTMILAPKSSQCRSIFVENILDDGRKLLSISNGKFIESRLTLEYKFGSTIKFSGSDLVDNIIGNSARIIVLDEFALGNNEHTFERLYPMVNYAGGNFIICSTPRGKNKLYTLYEQLKHNPDWHCVHENVFTLGLMTQEELDKIPMSNNLKAQEFLTSWDSPYENAIYEMPNIETSLEIDYNYPLLAGIDLGISDSTAIIYAQKINNKLLIVDAEHFNNTSLMAISERMKHKPDKMYCPHDVATRDLISGISRIEFLSRYFNCEILPRKGLMDGIDFVRNNWYNISFSPKSHNAIEAIKAYTTDDNGRPNHDENSHYADAIRYLVIGSMFNSGTTSHSYIGSNEQVNRWSCRDGNVYGNSEYYSMEN